MRQLLHWVLPSLNPKDRYHDYFLCSVALELLKAEGINNYFDIEFSHFKIDSVTFAKLPVEVIHVPAFCHSLSISKHLLKKALDFHLI